MSNLSNLLGAHKQEEKAKYEVCRISPFAHCPNCPYQHTSPYSHTALRTTKNICDSFARVYEFDWNLGGPFKTCYYL